MKMNKNFKKYLDMYPNLTEQFYIDDISAIELSREFCEAASLFLEGKVKIVISPFKKLSINNINKRVAELKDANEIKKYIEDICFLNEEFSTLNKIPLTRHMMSYLRIILIKNSIN
ncbi:hypothetical protein [Metamycoplasma arthritidis]|uniref:hypothetical protein n=1 Tax=Metamycoplasma arthritidis TaxID=2111 RepID=UPI0011D03C12|nr:hypothetical protein [Metamycoplasma arthritidis]